MADQTAVPGSATVARLGAVGPDLFVFVPASGALNDALHQVFTTGLAGFTSIDQTPSFTPEPGCRSSIR